MGEGIANKRWTPSQKQHLKNSRITGTRHLIQGAFTHAESLSSYIGASAVGYYDHNHSASLTESSPKGDDFLATLCQDWEAESEKITQLDGVRNVCLRIGLVLGKDGGALAKMKPPFKLGLGGKLGSGTQWMNWIHLEDLTDIIVSALTNSNMKGIYNAVSPNNVTNAQFTKSLGKVMNRPTLFPVPALILKLILGEMSQLLHQGNNVIPERLEKEGYSFQYDDLESALNHSL